MEAASPDRYNPVLTRWGHTWRMVLCVGISALAWADIAPLQWRENQVQFWVDLGFGLASFVLVFYRRRWPFAIALLLSLFGVVSAAAAGPGVLALVSLCTRRRVPQIVVVALAGIVAGQLYGYYEPSSSNDPPWLNFTLLVVVTAAVVAAGMYVGSRRELLWTLRERARQAEAEQGLRIDQARSSERERIAREMHDVLAHRISLVTMHAGALAYRTDLSPEQITETAKIIQAKSHEALTDLRQVLGLLREEQGPVKPQPNISDVPALIEEASAGGADVEFLSTIDPESTLVEQVGRTAYRVVQEALTNARKHGGGKVRVRLSGGPDEGLSVIVRNGKRLGTAGSLAVPGSGLGLVGLQERIELAHGTLTIDDSGDHFVLRGWLPWAT